MAKVVKAMAKAVVTKATKVAKALVKATVSKADSARVIRQIDKQGNLLIEQIVSDKAGKVLATYKSKYSKAELLAIKKAWQHKKGYAAYQAFKSEVGKAAAKRFSLDNAAVAEGKIRQGLQKYDESCSIIATASGVLQFTHRNKGFNFNDSKCHKAAEAIKKCA